MPRHRLPIVHTRPDPCLPHAGGKVFHPSHVGLDPLALRLYLRRRWRRLDVPTGKDDACCQLDEVGRQRNPRRGIDVASDHLGESLLRTSGIAPETLSHGRSSPRKYPFTIQNEFIILPLRLSIGSLKSESVFPRLDPGRTALNTPPRTALNAIRRTTMQYIDTYCALEIGHENAAYKR
jgi:hypothetical protein